MKSAYCALSPDGAEHLPALFEKIARLWTTEPTHDLRELTAIECPTLVMLGERDATTVEHAAAMARALPRGQLAVIPTLITSSCSRSRTW